jgi:hypothetical protein
VIVRAARGSKEPRSAKKLPLPLTSLACDRD